MEGVYCSERVVYLIMVTGCFYGIEGLPGASLARWAGRASGRRFAAYAREECSFELYRRLGAATHALRRGTLSRTRMVPGRAWIRVAAGLQGPGLCYSQTK